LDAEVSAWTEGVWRVICPCVCVDAPTSTAPFVIEAFFEPETPHQYDLASRFPEGGDTRGGEPLVDIASIVVSHDAAQLLISSISWPFTLDGHDDRFGGVLLQERKDVVDDWAEMLRAFERDWKDAMDES